MYRVMLLCLCCSASLCAQSISSGPGSHFASKVKQIDEFIDRFNRAADPASPRQQLYRLFDRERPGWDLERVEEFVGQMQHRPGEKSLDFYDPCWYAALECRFSYRGAPKTITLILQNQVAPNGGSKWVIVSIPESLDGVYCDDIPEAKDAGFYLHPMSHVTNFMELERAFADTENLQNLFDPRNQEMDFLAFKHGLLNGTLKYQYHDRITYHFLQLDNWIFTVDYFPRQHANAGWLISSLMKATEAEKERYRAKKLNLS